MIEAHELGTFAFCERQWFLRYVRQLPIKNMDMEIGKYEHTHYWQSTSKRKELYLCNEELGLKGKCDYVIYENGQNVPLEIKKGHWCRDAPRQNDTFQLLVYVKLLENHFQFKYHHAYVIYIGSRKKYKIELTEVLWQKFTDIVNKLATINRNVIPSTLNNHQCDKCSMDIICKVIK